MKPEVWAVWPTVNISRSRQRIGEWKARGYKTAVLINPPHQELALSTADRVLVQSEWKGFPVAVNLLCRSVPGDIVVVVGDDVTPDPIQTADEIAQSFIRRFPDLFGVAQPTADKYGCWSTCAVSPWIGRRFIQEAYGGKGPYWEGYYHYFSDEELQSVATKLGAFVQWESVLQYHHHWERYTKERPQHLLEAKDRWQADRSTFFRRTKSGFPHHERVPQ